jgi:hypothetical protein
MNIIGSTFKFRDKREYGILANITDYGTKETATGTGIPPERQFCLGLSLNSPDDCLEVIIWSVNELGEYLAGIYTGQDSDEIKLKLIQSILDMANEGG